MAEKHLTDGTTALAGQPRVIKIEAAEKPRNAQLSGLYPRQLGLR